MYRLSYPATRGFIIGCVGIMSGTVTATSYAQANHVRESAAYAIQSTHDGQKTRQSPLDRTIALELRDASVADVLNAVALRANVRVLYSSELLPAGARVTIVQPAITVSQALASALRGTGLTWRTNTDGVIAIVRGSGTESQRGQMSGIIVGRITHASTKQPISGATVTVGGTTKSVMTDEKGMFRLTVDDGEHTLHIRALGTVRQSRKVTVPADQTVHIEITLEPSASVLDEVVVTGAVAETERRAIPTPITVITADQIEKRGITRIEQLFRGEVPGVYSLDFGTQAYVESSSELGRTVQAPVYSRGSSSLEGKPNPLKTYIDGVELVDPAYLGLIDPSSIERIEIIVGPQAATVYGSDAMGGVMQIFTKKGTRSAAPDIVLNLRYGILQSNLSRGLTPVHNDGVQFSGGSGPEFSYSAGLSYNYSGQWQPYLYSRAYGVSAGMTHTRGRFALSGSGSVTGNATGTLRESVGRGGSGYVAEVGVTGGFATSPYEYELSTSGEALPGQFVAGIFSQRVMKSSGQTISLSGTYRPSQWWNHSFTIGRSHTKFMRVPERPLVAFPYDTLWEAGVSPNERSTIDYHMTFLPRLGFVNSALTFGGNGSWSEGSSMQGCWVNARSNAYVPCYGFGGFRTTVDVSSTASRNIGAFGSWQIGLWDRVFFTLGVRAENSENYGKNYKVDWTPSNGLTYVVDVGNVTIKFLGSYGRATRLPDASWLAERIIQTPGWEVSEWVEQAEALDLRPERSVGPQGGVEMYWGGRGSVTVNRFTQTVSDLIQYVLVDSLVARHEEGYGTIFKTHKYMNAAKIRNQGWEGTASFNLWRISAKATYSWTDSRVLAIAPMARESNGSFYAGLKPGDMFNYSPTHTGNFVFSYAFAGTSATWVANWRGAANQDIPSAFFLMKRHYDRLSMYGPIATFARPSQTIPGRLMSNVIVSQRVTPWVSATLNVQNVSNNIHSDAGAFFPTLGRQTLLGVSLRRPASR